MTLLCTKCKESKEDDKFSLDSGNTNRRGKFSWCKTCVNSHRTSDDRQRYNLKAKYGLTVEGYQELLKMQGSQCAICEIALTPSWHSAQYDHDHKTGNFRAFLCSKCNRGLGHFDDSIDLLQKAINYLLAHNPTVTRVKEDIQNARIN